MWIKNDEMVGLSITNATSPNWSGVVWSGLDMDGYFIYGNINEIETQHNIDTTAQYG